MLLVVLVLVLVAGGVLAGAVVSDQPDLAWLSVLVSVLGVALLTVDRLRRRSVSARAKPKSDPAEPGEERSNAAAVADPAAEVLVIDERPRYHVRTCELIGDRKTIALTLREARELGFTPCAHCAPNATLASERRRPRKLADRTLD
ncbi:hypothetical protein MOQ72_24045 [Saccharopolyspora sp. K220]|uniref:hypothetical protein n=1 Tax=Saccharopolyspora soli TaxID=2926618 RepID=UPI001F587C0E|nr:hypothetical protein [Saccharopolyspora soli]MCI2420526.1 hypothetical protein [Saccharopolyspora soli]